MDPIKSHDPFKEGRRVRDIQQKREKRYEAKRAVEEI